MKMNPHDERVIKEVYSHPDVVEKENKKRALWQSTLEELLQDDEFVEGIVGFETTRKTYENPTWKERTWLDRLIGKPESKVPKHLHYYRIEVSNDQFVDPNYEMPNYRFFGFSEEAPFLQALELIKSRTNFVPYERI